MKNNQYQKRATLTFDDVTIRFVIIVDREISIESRRDGERDDDVCSDAEFSF